MQWEHVPCVSGRLLWSHQWHSPFCLGSLINWQYFFYSQLFLFDTTKPVWMRLMTRRGNVLVFNHKQNLKLLYYASILFISMSIRFQYSTEALYVYFGPCVTIFMLINRMAAEKNTPDLMTNHWLIDLLNHTGLRILVNLLLDTLPMLGNVLLLCFFVFFIFGIIGVQLWAGLLRNRCYLEENFTLWVEPCVCGMFICWRLFRKEEKRRQKKPDDYKMEPLRLMSFVIWGGAFGRLVLNGLKVIIYLRKESA